MLYFAYGANMDEEMLAERGVEFKPVCSGKAKDMRLVFYKPAEDGSGMADMQDDRGSFVEGVVYDVAESSLANLDVHKGVDRGHYRRQMVRVQTFKGELECIAYRASKFRTGLKPSAAYLQTLIRGAEKHRLSPGYIMFLRSHDSR